MEYRGVVVKDKQKFKKMQEILEKEALPYRLAFELGMYTGVSIEDMPHLVKKDLEGKHLKIRQVVKHAAEMVLINDHLRERVEILTVDLEADSPLFQLPDGELLEAQDIYNVLLEAANEAGIEGFGWDTMVRSMCHELYLLERENITIVQLYTGLSSKGKAFEFIDEPFYRQIL